MQQTAECWNCTATMTPDDTVCPRCGQAPIDDTPPPPTPRERVANSFKLAPIWAKLAAALVVALLVLYFWNPSKGHKTNIDPPKADANATPAAPAIPKRDGRAPEIVKAAGQICLVARDAKWISDCQITDISQEVDVRAPVYTEEAKRLCDDIATLVRSKTGAFQGTDWTLRVFSNQTQGYALAQCKLSTY
ncbi:hypothetical protein [Lysobacter soyae]|uniref:Zinc ribbon domain-containing protein n=1 Tax=Lysobacter soyae TaxID=2764185 RepID=A0ABX8WLT3_9GAMM|nr:hypothetical protein [Lysobacter sp. CJ11]QYR52393.1 hypothetical protein H8L67_07245 [Lysobacter sp. CJ11]